MVEVRESAYHHRKWTSSVPVTKPVQELDQTQELSREMVRPQRAGHLNQVTDKSFSTETRRIVNYYADTGDAPAWIATSTDKGGTYTWQRNVLGVTGDFAVLQSSDGTAVLQLTNLHGDVVATVDDDAAAVGTTAYFEQTEFGDLRVAWSSPLKWCTRSDPSCSPSVGRTSTIVRDDVNR